MPVPPGLTLVSPLWVSQERAGWQVLSQEATLGVYNSLTVTQVLLQMWLLSVREHLPDQIRVYLRLFLTNSKGLVSIPSQFQLSPFSG